MSRRKKANIKSEKDIVFEYFRRIRNKDVSGLLDLFTDDAVIYEPFSKSEDIQGETTGLHGKQRIEPFLGVVVMANEGVEGNITIEKIYEKMDDSNNKSTEISAIVTFERGDKITARFTFELISPTTSNSNNSKNTNQREKKIKSLHIQFAN
jgi:ketosteroid isomerase-like protein